MSDTIALIRFPSGQLRAAYFFGDPEVVVPLLFPLEEAEQVLEGGLDPLLEQLASVDDDAPEPQDTEDVAVWVPYGRPTWWEGRASRTAALLVSGDGSEPRQVHLGTPAWVPPEWRVDDVGDTGEVKERRNGAMDDWLEFGDPSGEVTQEDIDALLSSLRDGPPEA